jgi:hypothetical protein
VDRRLYFLELLLSPHFQTTYSLPCARSACTRLRMVRGRPAFSSSSGTISPTLETQTT